MTMVSPGERLVRRGRPGYDQDTVLQVAVTVFNEHGYEATSMGLLADRLGISKSAIYHHVDSKESLLQLALEKALGSLESLLAAETGADLPATQRLERFLRGTVLALIEQLPYVTLLLRLRGNTEMERKALRRRRDFDRTVAALIREAQQEGELRGDLDPRVAERLIFGTVNSVVEWYRPDGELDAEELADQVLAMIFNGLRSAYAPATLRQSH